MLAARPHRPARFLPAGFDRSINHRRQADFGKWTPRGQGIETSMYWGEGYLLLALPLAPYFHSGPGNLDKAGVV